MIKDIFSTKIYETEFPNYDKIQESISAEILSYFSKENTQKSFNTYPKMGEPLDLHTKLKNREVIEFIEKHLKIFWEDLNYTNRLNPKILHMAANYIPSETGWMEKHLHTQDIISIFYVSGHSQSGDIVLYNPLDCLISRLPVKGHDTYHNVHYFTISPKPGKLILFPGYLHHSVNNNYSNLDRISLVAECGIYEQG